MLRGLEMRVDRALLDRFQIMLSNRQPLDPDRKHILWAHDSIHFSDHLGLADAGWQDFDKIVFVSYWQRQQFIDRYGIPFDRTAVMKNAIDPIAEHRKPDTGTLNIIYHSTPHRGLALLYPAFRALKSRHRDIRLTVFSSLALYGRPDLDDNYADLFAQLRRDADVDYRGAVSNDEVRSALLQAHLFAYPSIYEETSCLCLIEAMSARCLCVHPDLAALPETAANWTWMYGYDADVGRHGASFTVALDLAISNMRTGKLDPTLRQQKAYTDRFYNWRGRSRQWTALLGSLAQQ